ncbi:histone methyltransferase set2 [Podila epigama]|nr:histone methyltransferase set2 [Podila epigama]
MFSNLDEEDSVLECGQVARLNVIGVNALHLVSGSSSVPNVPLTLKALNAIPPLVTATGATDNEQQSTQQTDTTNSIDSVIKKEDIFKKENIVKKEDIVENVVGNDAEDEGEDDDLLPIHHRRRRNFRRVRRIRLIDSDEDEQETEVADHENIHGHADIDDNGAPQDNSQTYDSSLSDLSSLCDDDLDSQLSLTPPPSPHPRNRAPEPPSTRYYPSAVKEAQSSYQTIEHNIYRGTNTGNPPMNDTFPCQCKYNPRRDPRWMACGADCINRNLFVECIEDDCPCGKYCLNRRFQTMDNASVDVIRTEKKGFGLRAMQNIDAGEFVMEYIGEVLPHASFLKRTREYSLAGVEHFYFMSLQGDEVIDATKKGCLARFINHSCNPNCHLEKWIVGSKVRIGIFSIKEIKYGEELTFDYQFERYGLAEDADQDEIELEKDIILQAPKKKSLEDDFYLKERNDETPVAPLGIEDPKLMEKLARIMFMQPKVPKSKRLLAKLMATTDRTCLRRFLTLRGLVILKAWLRHYKDEPDIVIGILILLPNLPLASRNAIEDSMIEDAVQEVAHGSSCESKEMAKNAIALNPSDVNGASAEVNTGLVSPSESVQSTSTESYTWGKRIQEDEAMASPVVEKKIRFAQLPHGHREKATSLSTQEDLLHFDINASSLHQRHHLEKGNNEQGDGGSVKQFSWTESDLVHTESLQRDKKSKQDYCNNELGSSRGWPSPASNCQQIRPASPESSPEQCSVESSPKRESHETRNHVTPATPISPPTATVPPSAADLVPRPIISTAPLQSAQPHVARSLDSPSSLVTPTTELAMVMPLACSIHDTGGYASQRLNRSGSNPGSSSRNDPPVSPITFNSSSSRHISPELQDISTRHLDPPYHIDSNETQDLQPYHERHRSSSLYSRPSDHYSSSSSSSRPYYSNRQYRRESYHYQSRHGSSLSPKYAPDTRPISPTLPPGWASARDGEDRIYYYHEQTRVTQWEFPTIDNDSAKSKDKTRPHSSHYYWDAEGSAAHRYNAMDDRHLIHDRPNSTRSSTTGIHAEYNGDYSLGCSSSQGDAPPYRHARIDSGAHMAKVPWHSFEGRTRLHTKPLNERDLKAAISSTVVKTMTKHKIKLDSSETFKRLARKVPWEEPVPAGGITHMIAEKEMRTQSFLNGQLCELNEDMKEKIRKFTREYLTKALKQQEERYGYNGLEQYRRYTTVDELVNGIADSEPHITITGASAAMKRQGLVHITQPWDTEKPDESKYLKYEDCGHDVDLQYGEDSDPEVNHDKRNQAVYQSSMTGFSDR